MYSKQLIYDETVEFTAGLRWAAADGRPILLRSDLPEHYIWDMHEYYAFVIREGPD